MAEPKEKPASSLRSPKPKKTLGLSVPSALRLPHDDLIKREEFPTPVTPVTVVTPVTPVTDKGDAAPKRDFTRTANSIVRDAIPAGVFSGKGKQLYDYLYLKTRGAIVPKHSARIPTGDVMKGSGMTRHTYRAHLQRLVSSGLVKVDERAGEHGGNVFTVYLPEETGINRSGTPVTPVTPVTVQDRDMVQGSEVDRGDRGLNVDGADTSVDPKTSSLRQDQIDDDLGQRLRALERELTGKSSPSANWKPLFELLADELKAAASRTGSVSDVPAFFAVHLRRRFAKPDAPLKTGKRATEPVPLAPEQIEPPAPDEVEEYERLRAELEGK